MGRILLLAIFAMLFSRATAAQSAGLSSVSATITIPSAIFADTSSKCCFPVLNLGKMDRLSRPRKKDWPAFRAPAGRLNIIHADFVVSGEDRYVYAITVASTDSARNAAGKAIAVTVYPTKDLRDARFFRSEQRLTIEASLTILRSQAAGCYTQAVPIGVCMYMD